MVFDNSPASPESLPDFVDQKPPLRREQVVGSSPYDFSIPSKKYGLILIEYNGIQHYESSEFFGGDEQLKKQKEHDRLKKEYAKKHGYKLIIIKYTYDSYESISEYMAKELKKIEIWSDSPRLKAGACFDERK